MADTRPSIRTIVVICTSLALSISCGGPTDNGDTEDRLGRVANSLRRPLVIEGAARTRLWVLWVAFRLLAVSPLKRSMS